MKLSTFKRKDLKDRVPLQEFLTKLDEIVPENFETIVAEEDAKTWATTHCLSCANCCKKMTPTFTPADLKRISNFLGMTVAAFKKKWTFKDEAGDINNLSQPCQFLNVDNTCSIYEVRPVDCADFPHHHKQPFDQYNDTFTTNVAYCPATFELVSRLKKRVEKEYEW